MGKLEVLLLDFTAKDQRKMGLHTGGLFILVLSFDPRYVPSYFVSFSIGTTKYSVKDKAGY